MAVFGAARLLDRLLHRNQHFVAVDALLAGDRVGDLQQLHPGDGDRGVHGHGLFLSGLSVFGCCSSAAWCAAIRSSVSTSLAFSISSSGSASSAPSTSIFTVSRLEALEAALEALAAVDRRAGLELRLEAGEALVVLRAGSAAGRCPARRLPANRRPRSDPRHPSPRRSPATDACNRRATCSIPSFRSAITCRVLRWPPETVRRTTS